MCGGLCGYPGELSGNKIKPDLKFILVTGYCLEEAEGHVLRNMSAIMMKPYTTEKVAALIRKVLDE